MMDQVDQRQDKPAPLPDQVFAHFAHRIINGDLKAGDSLPPEREMAEQFGVNRHVVREAVKRAQQVGLVTVVHGGGTKVLDVREHAGLGLLELLAQHAEEGTLTYKYWLSVVEMRVAIASDIARLCAERAPRELKDELIELVEAMRSAKDDIELLELDEQFWSQATRGSDNFVYRLAFNTLLTVSEVMRDASAWWMAQELRNCDFNFAIADAISRGDDEAAQQAVKRSMGTTLEALRAMSESEVTHAIAETRVGVTRGRPIR
jgi:DNA-binding FadR family transcriptional regulator